LRCTSYLLHAETPPSLRWHTGTKTDTRLFLFLSPNHATLPRLSSLSPPATSLRHVIVSRKDRSATDRATGNKMAPSTVLLEELCMHRSHGPLQYPSPFHEGCPTRRWVDALCPIRSLRSGYVRGGSTCLPAATRYFVTKLISKGDINSARTGPAGRDSVFEAGEGHFALPNRLRFATHYGHYT